MVIGGKPFSLNVLKGGINRLRTKGGASQSSLYDLLNGFIDITGAVQQRPGTTRLAALSDSTVGLCYFNGYFNVFSNSQVSVPSGFLSNVLVNPNNAADEPSIIWFAQPFMGFLYVVCEFVSGQVIHYWLQSGGAWAANTVYQVGAIVTPAASPNGLAYQATRTLPANPTWSPEALVTEGTTKVEPTTANGYYYTATNVEGTNPHTGETEPTWVASTGAVVYDYGDYAVSSTPAITSSDTVPLSTSITDRYGDSNTIANVSSGTTGAVTTLPTPGAAVSTWTKGTIYPTGSVVIPTATQGAYVNAIPNGDFEDGNDGTWTFSGSGEQWSITNGAGDPFQGTYQAINPPGASNAYITMTTGATVTPGQSVTLTAYVHYNGSSTPAMDMSIGLNWYNGSGTLISSTDSGTAPGVGSTAWTLATVTGTAPAGAATVKAYGHMSSGTSSRATGAMDLFSWNLETAVATTDFIYEAVQSGPGTSGSTQPTWPTVAGNTVIDNTVTWQAVGSSIITWTASPIMESGSTEPTWPTTIGGVVHDGGMAWTCISRAITDANCPQTVAVALGASHVFACDNDIVAYSAAVNPTDWTTANNAGYLPVGLNTYGANPFEVLSLYRGNLLCFNAGGYQMWQIDPDPANMALLDAQPIGSSYTRAADTIANDTLFLTVLGVRNIGTTGATANMQSGMLGQPIDSLIQAQLAAGTYTPIAFYLPSRGQYWLAFGPQVFVMTVNGNGQKSWSRYVFPDTITDFTLDGETLYMRTLGNLVWEFDINANYDDTGGDNVAFEGIVQWNFLDLSNFGYNKMIDGFDIVGSGTLTVNFLYNENDMTQMTDDYTLVTTDTLTGQPIAMPLNCPSFSLMLTFAGGNDWSLQAVNIYATPLGNTG